MTGDFEAETLELLAKIWPHLQDARPSAAVAAGGKPEARCFEFLRTGLRGTVPVPTFPRGGKGPEGPGAAGAGVGVASPSVEVASPSVDAPPQAIPQPQAAPPPVGASGGGPTQVFAYPRAMPEVQNMMRGAERSVRMMAYTLDHPGALVSLEALARRGGTVELLIDFSMLKGGTVRREAAFVRSVLVAGGVVRTFSAKQRHKMPTGMHGAFAPHLHAKVGIVDDKKVWIGSLNMTQNSEGWFEIITTSCEASVVGELRGVFASWWELGDVLTLEALTVLEANISTRGSSAVDRGIAEVQVT